MIIKKIKIFNFGSFRKAEFDLNDQGIVLIKGWSEDNQTSNGSGKSTLVEALCWCLFGQTPKGLRADDVINRSTGKDCAVQIDLIDNENEYQIVRTRNDTKYKNALIFKINNQTIHGSDARKTQELIDSNLGIDYLTFINSVLFPQNSKFKFVLATDAEKKEILSNILGLNWIDLASQKVKEDLNLLQSSIKEKHLLIETTNSRIKDHSESSEQITKNIQIKESEIIKQKDFFDRQTLTIEEQIKNLKEDTQKQLEEQENAINASIDRLHRDLDERAEEIAKNIENKQKQLLKLEPNFSVLEHTNKINELQKKISVIEDIEQKNALLSETKKDLLVKIAICKKKRDVLIQQIDQLHSLDGAKCPTCSQLIDNILVSELSCGPSGELEDANKEYCALTDEQKALLEKEDKYKNIINKKSKIQNILNDLHIQMTTVNAGKQQQEILKKEIIDLKKQSSKVETDYFNKISDLAVEKKRLIKNTTDRMERNKEALFKQKEQLLADFNHFKTENDFVLESLRSQLVEKNNKIKELENLISEHIKESTEKAKKSHHLEVLKDMFSNGGLKSFIMDTAIGELNNKVEKYLDHLFDGALRIVFDTVSQTKTGKIKQSIGCSLLLNNKDISQAQLSGGELKRVSLAVDLALSDLIANRGDKSFNLLIFDEATENLDESGRSAFFNLLQDLSAEKDSIFVITHDERLQTQFDSVIQVVKNNGISEVVYD